MPKDKNTTQNQQTRDQEELLSSIDSLIYESSHDHLLDELRWLNRLLAAQVLRQRQVNFHERIEDFRDFFIADSEIDVLLEAGVFEMDRQVDHKELDHQVSELLQQALLIREEIDRRVQKSFAQKIFLPLMQLGRCFHLSQFELRMLIICLAPQIDVRYEKLYAYLQNDLTQRCPGVDLILNLLCQNSGDRLQKMRYLQATGSLRHFYLIENILDNPGNFYGPPLLKVDSRIISYVLEHSTVDPRVVHFLHFRPPFNWNEVVVNKKLQTRLQQLFQLIINNTFQHHPIIYLHGMPGTGKKTLAQAICSELGIKLAVVDVRSILPKPDTFQEKARLILREGLLQSCAIYFDHLEEMEKADEENPNFLRWLIQEIHDLGWIVFLGSQKSPPAQLLKLANIYPVEILAPDFTAQKILWGNLLNGISRAVDFPELEEITTRFNLTGGQIFNAVKLARQTAVVRDPQNIQISFDDLLASCRAQSQPKLASLARKIEPHLKWNDIILPEEQMQQLDELINQVKQKQRVMGEWGFAEKLALGRGLTALFAGPSGTGKTMAAEIVANELGIDLFKIDLSAVVSKYIGETEKNLNRIFTEAEHSNAILFFDEADALLGKRSEVKDAHDRYSNIEIAYLLQKMEEYEGITILATNLRQNIDEAFTRRIRFIIEFPFPDEASRLRIWQGIFPKKTPLTPQINLKFLARQFKMSGGNIRNIALSATFLAASNGQKVSMEHLILATKREFNKMGKICGQNEFGEYYELIQN